MERYKFWMVFYERGPALTKQYFVRSEAEAEAQRVAKNSGRTAYVMESLGGYEIPEPVIGSFETREVAPSYRIT